MRIVLEAPKTWMDSPLDGERNAVFFANVLAQLCTFNFPIYVREAKYGSDSYPRYFLPGEIVFSYHTYLDFPLRTPENMGREGAVFRLKEAPIPPYYSIDSLGYSGWSSINFDNKFKDKINDIPLDKAIEFIENVKETYLTKRISKYPQKNEQVLDKDYVFFPLQVPDDPVSKLSNINSRELLEEAVKIAQEEEVLLLIKRHPLDNSDLIAEVLELVKGRPFVKFTDGNVIDLVENARSVIAVNSGVSLEALYLGASVWNSGKSEWWGAVNKISCLSDVRKAFKKEQPEMQSFQKKILAFLVSDFWVRNDDPKSIKNKLKQCIDSCNKEYLVSEAGYKELLDRLDLSFNEILKLSAENNAYQRKLLLAEQLISFYKNKNGSIKFLLKQLGKEALNRLKKKWLVKC